MRSKRLLRIVSALACAVVLASCGQVSVDEAKLRGFVTASQERSRTYTYIEAASDRWLRLDVQLSDDLRYSFRLTTAAGPFLDAIVSDDALLVHVLDRKQLIGLPVSYGNPATVALLASGQWVEDPAGAPPLAKPRTDLQRRQPPPNPFDIAAHLFDQLGTEIAGASRVVKFNPDDIEYRPSQDPFAYPDRSKLQSRYDLRQPKLPTRADQIQGKTFELNESFFRKTSAYVQSGTVYQICEMVDVVDHEEFVKMREQHIKNPFLANLEHQATSGQTLTPIRPRSIWAAVTYGSSVRIVPPAHPVIASLTGFVAGLNSAFQVGLLAPGNAPPPTECLRPRSQDRGGIPPIVPTSFATASAQPAAAPVAPANPAAGGSVSGTP